MRAGAAEARSFEKVIEAVATDFTVLLDLDVALVVESNRERLDGGAAASGCG